MKITPKITDYFSKFERFLWITSITLIIISFLIFDRENHLILIASIVGTTSLIFNAKGNPTGQFLMIIFSVLYGIISFKFRYYGEMITYLGMTAPMAVFSLISWIKNPYNGNKAEVEINSLNRKEILFMMILSLMVTSGFYFILKFFENSNLLPSTLSVTTSFLAVYLTFRRNPFHALAYACNDIILIILWTLAALSDISYISVIICFMIFLINDIYGFTNWKKIQLKQQK